MHLMNSRTCNHVYNVNVNVLSLVRRVESRENCALHVLNKLSLWFGYGILSRRSRSTSLSLSHGI